MIIYNNFRNAPEVESFFLDTISKTPCVIYDSGWWTLMLIRGELIKRDIIPENGPGINLLGYDVRYYEKITDLLFSDLLVSPNYTGHCRETFFIYVSSIMSIMKLNPNPVYLISCVALGDLKHSQFDKKVREFLEYYYPSSTRAVSHEILILKNTDTHVWFLYSLNGNRRDTFIFSYILYLYITCGRAGGDVEKITQYLMNKNHYWSNIVANIFFHDKKAAFPFFNSFANMYDLGQTSGMDTYFSFLCEKIITAREIIKNYAFSNNIDVGNMPFSHPSIFTNINQIDDFIYKKGQS